jgi:nucleoside-diphosphate-sugar epimerase
MKLDLVSNKVLIFGIEGFTGKYLSAYLEDNGYRVYGTSYDVSKDKFYSVDITLKPDIEKVLAEVIPDYVIVLSGISFPAHGHNEDFYTINTIGSINILETLVKLNQIPKKILLASSATVYGNQGVEILSEDLCPMPSNHYAASKYAMERLAIGYFSKLPIIVTRPFNYIGVGQAEHFLISKIVKHYADKASTIELGNLHVAREFNSVDFVADVYLRLMQSSVDSEIVNICSSKAIKLLDVIDMMSEIAGYKIEVKVNPDFVRENEIPILKGSKDKLSTLIGKIELDDFKNTLKKMYSSMSSS